MKHRWHFLLFRRPSARRYRVDRWPFIPPGRARVLVAWGKENKRFFPWRTGQTPFALLVAEILLRKTTAQQVSKVFSDLIDKYGTPEKLAFAGTEELQKMLRPLGLAKQRSAALKAVACHLVSHHQGLVPPNPRELEKIPHIGPYAANAVGCFGVGLPLPVVDANVIRVLDRFTGVPTPGPNPHRMRSIWHRSIRSLPITSVQDYNYALLDLGALVCKSKPLCSKCCLTSGCAEAKKQRRTITAVPSLIIPTGEAHSK